MLWWHASELVRHDHVLIFHKLTQVLCQPYARALADTWQDVLKCPLLAPALGKLRRAQLKKVHHIFLADNEHACQIKIPHFVSVELSMPQTLFDSSHNQMTKSVAPSKTLLYLQPAPQAPPPSSLHAFGVDVPTDLMETKRHKRVAAAHEPGEKVHIRTYNSLG